MLCGRKKPCAKKSLIVWGKNNYFISLSSSKEGVIEATDAINITINTSKNAAPNEYPAFGPKKENMVVIVPENVYWALMIIPIMLIIMKVPDNGTLSHFCGI